LLRLLGCDARKRAAFDRALLIRAIGRQHLYMSPPLVISASEIDLMPADVEP
jgi:adenosylmethionine-8-amino-7-oxononanoate aminotransferase